MARGGNKGQLPLDLALAPAQGRDDFLVSESNRAAVELIDRWPDWDTAAAVLVGPPGSGKSHLLAVWAGRAGAPIVPATDLAAAGAVELVARHGLGIEAIDDPAADETALFHTLNAAREHGRSVLMTSRMAPAAWTPKLADLASRLRAAMPVELAEPDDEFLKRVLVKLFADRQLVVEPAVIGYIAVRMERSLEAANLIVREVDRRALAERRPVTRAVAAAVLATIGGERAADRE